jgi:hypothetical protein
MSSLNVDCVDLFCKFFVLFYSSSAHYHFPSPLSSSFTWKLVHIVTYCSYRTTTKHLLSPLRYYFYSSIDHTYRFWFLLFSLFPLYSIILPLDHTNPLSAICKLIYTYCANRPLNNVRTEFPFRRRPRVCVSYCMRKFKFNPICYIKNNINIIL